ncbi:hypothetical protein B0H16DRAFT_971557 [Mycena metata]|uniref:Arrestin-like N-terminal domain-containing protein n=1 Tax=Mycena metata TaxID=1033252 RepID=A0AAD7INT1_9AGAR|nr:hypothetical protein B0H16DRAFT_971557 [Mycena metata]
MSSPPVYGSSFTSQSFASLPAYSARDRPSTAGAVRELTEHTFEIKDKKKKAWATLKLKSNAKSPANLPTFLEGNKITGSVTLDLSSSEKILGVRVLIRGQIITGPQDKDRVYFLDTSTPLWLKGMANPRDSVSGASGSHYNGKLSGDYHWPFSISLPKEVTLSDPTGKQSLTYHLPQSFLERTSRASVYYELFVHIARSTLRVDDKLQTMFIYVPAIRPDPPSRLRQLAYRQNGPIPGPDADPEGWHTLRTVSVRGNVFNARRVKIQCIVRIFPPRSFPLSHTRSQLSLAKPLSYTRGSVIPCSLTYLCDDSQALNLVCTPATTNICLHREVSFQNAPVAAEYSVPRETQVTDSILEITRAVWWPVYDGRGSSCRFDGEMHLPKSLKPTSNMSHFAVRYYVVMLPFQVTAFTAEAPPRLILKQEVQIATMLPKGPKPRVYTPPTYEPEIGDNSFIPPARGYI